MTESSRFRHALSAKNVLIGEGNFSFALALQREISENNLSCAQYATDYRPGAELDQLTRNNIDKLSSLGATVLLDVDASSLHCHTALQSLSGQLTTVIFNFPHVPSKKMKIGANRLLLRNFFTSLKHLHPESQVLVSLCAGQGGVPVDTIQRTYADTWKIVAMATYGDFILTEVCPFEQPLGYESCLYKLHTSKRFNTVNALTYTFRSAPLNCCPRPKWKSLFPPMYEHHISLWIDNIKDWRDSELVECAQDFIGEPLHLLELIEIQEMENGLLSKLFRVCYQSKFFALSKETSNDLQNEFRSEVGKRLQNKVTVR